MMKTTWHLKFFKKNALKIETENEKKEETMVLKKILAEMYFLKKKITKKKFTKARVREAHFQRNKHDWSQILILMHA